MRWIEAAVPAAAGEIDTLCERLAALGVEGVSIEDEADFRRFLRKTENSGITWTRSWSSASRG